ncbi:YbhB/YbcL family Raf kinase inhibitor-like protein [Alcanivorax sp. DP30]|uniref:YbhB/YbcL family Raf kinase inhibitor-like protein n=1 Tax=Alcanivorax sp. DP30 TaxID=2606217 RepID=UPI00136AE924|nr:YbhB/YbcL family Raf kinase inhibitor-like protein [Alcanivorax sp. DP30]MZR61864.1 YbhB/YbcL family Raf kinase inhibitor-like protein [Alcanivorax sp. DP30]
MQLVSDSLTDGTAIDKKYAFAIIDPKNHVALSDNHNPHLAWSGAPEGTRSFAVVVHDPDVPSAGDDVNQEGREVPESLPRVDFYHWTLFDIPADQTRLEEGAHCNGITPRGKNGPEAGNGLSHGKNDYTGWFAGDADMEGDYFGYDGPCPPWNDSIIHRYVFTVYALDVDTLPAGNDFSGAALVETIKAHALDSASITCTYTLNPRLA